MLQTIYTSILCNAVEIIGLDTCNVKFCIAITPLQSLDVDSMNPAVDVGQMEGALVMGLGMMLREREIMDPDTGRLLTASAWVLVHHLACQKFYMC